MIITATLLLKRVSCFNPLVPSAHRSTRIAIISILKLKGIIKKIRRDYESVEESSLS